MLENLTKKQKIIFAFIIIFMIIIIIYYIYSTLANTEYVNENISENSFLDNNLEIEKVPISKNVTETEEIIIHISGCVKENKLVNLPEGSRINDAIEAAGGLTDEADLSNVNLAYILQDGEKIYIPKKGENVTDNNIIQPIPSSLTSISQNKNKKININKASQSELENIPGIGQSTALKIINYRTENGKFKSIEDIKNVSGIGDAKYEKLKNYITIN